MLLSKLKHLETVRLVATNVGVVPESELMCRIMLHGCPLVSPPIVDYGVQTDYGVLAGKAQKNDQNTAKGPEDSLTTKDNPYFRG